MGDPYRETSYQSSLISIRVDQQSASIDQLLQCNNQSSWAFLTAWNPHGEMTSIDDNQRANQELLHDLQQENFIILPGWGIGDDRVWPPEASFLVIGIAKDQAISLAKRYKQRAIVLGMIGTAASLYYLEEER